MAEGGFLGELQAKIRAIPGRFWDDAFLVVAIFLIALASFGLGRLSVLYEANEPLRVVQIEEEAPAVTAETGKYVASISGSRYHLPWCPGAQSIKEENKIWFETRDDAEVAGYTPAVNCIGL